MAYTTINKPNTYFNTVLYTGNGSTQSITGVNFKPDLVWLKQRSASTYYHRLQDAVRGAGKTIYSNYSDAEGNFGTGTDGSIRTFDTDGFSIGSEAGTNTNAVTHVAWNWLGANTTASNTQGSITSTVSANTTAGFSIVSYTGTSANATVGHGLGVAPKFIIIKNRQRASDWVCYHAGITNSQNGWIRLNLTNAWASTSIIFNNTAPTSSVFSLGSYDYVNQSAETHIAYCFAEVKGFSKFGSYTGNGSTDGTFVYTGFKPAFVIIKNSGAIKNWLLFDNKRNTSNPENLSLYPNTTASDTSVSDYNTLDFLSNGFKLRGGSTGVGDDTNGSGGTYIYMAFAEQPLVGTNNIPCTAR